MEKELLSSIDGIGIYPLISLVMFFILFVCVIIYVMKIDRNYLRKMSGLPLENDNRKYKQKV